jgi:hypothetical protein
MFDQFYGGVSQLWSWERYFHGGCRQVFQLNFRFNLTRNESVMSAILKHSTLYEVPLDIQTQARPGYENKLD